MVFSGLMFVRSINLYASVFTNFFSQQNHGTLTFYGGLYEDNPKDPNITDLQLWSYNTQQSSWYLANTPGRTISRAAEGASAFMDGIGLQGLDLENVYW